MTRTRGFLSGGFLLLLLLCGAGAVAVWTGRFLTPNADAPASLVDLYTRVPFTPVSALGAVPPTYTPNPLTPQSSGGAVGTLRPTMTPPATVDLADNANVVAASATPSRVTALPTVPVTQTPTGTAAPPPATDPPPTAVPTATIAPTATSAPAPTATPQSQPTVVARNPKKGIAAAYAWAYEDGHVPFRIGWYYTWSLYPGAWEGVPGLEFVPMWPCNGTVDYVVGLLGAEYDGYLLIMNEPDHPDQCTMSIDEAAQHYLTVRNALPNARLIGPQVILGTGGGSFTGYTAQWRERVRQLTGSYPQVHGYGIHIYPFFSGSGTANEVLTSWCDTLNAWGEVGQKELWVTEFGVHNFDGTPDQVRAQVRQMVNLFESGVNNCEIARYSYFTDRRADVDAANPTPTIAPVLPNYLDFYWRNSWLLSYAGEAYRDAGNR